MYLRCSIVLTSLTSKAAFARMWLPVDDCGWDKREGSQTVLEDFSSGSVGNARTHTHTHLLLRRDHVCKERLSSRSGEQMKLIVSILVSVSHS